MGHPRANRFNQTVDPDNPIKRFLFLQLIQPSHCVSRRSSCQKVLLSLDVHSLVDLGLVFISILPPCCLLAFQMVTYKQEDVEDRVGELPMFLPCSAPHDWSLVLHSEIGIATGSLSVACPPSRVAWAQTPLLLHSTWVCVSFPVSRQYAACGAGHTNQW